MPGEIGPHDQWSWPFPYYTYAELIQKGGSLRAVAQAHKAAWLRTSDALADGDGALLVSHGGAIVPALV